LLKAHQADAFIFQMAIESVNPIYGESISVETGSRLHLGLLEICPSHPNLFGGIGLMTASPVTRLEGIPFADSIDVASDRSDVVIAADEYWKPRIEELCNRWLLIHESSRLPLRQVELLQKTPAHRGLGSGTQVACAVVALLEAAAGRQISKIEHLRHLTGRGARSHVGLQGFLEGGFIVDYGQKAEQTNRTVRYPFPNDWRLVLVRASTEAGDSGSAEQKMFAECASVPNPNRSRMLELIESEIIPSVLTEDWDLWDRSVGLYGYYAGQVFARGQGGVYRTKEIGQLVDTLARLGCLGGAQSSWGPTVLAVAKDAEHAKWLITKLQDFFPDATLEVTTVQNGSATIT
jgi:beta-RFAP synthase